jgi:uncharacterized protein YceK
MEKRLTRRAAAVIAATCLVPLVLSGCATKDSRRAQDQADAEAPVAKASSSIQRYRIKDWSAPSDHVIIVITNDGTRFRAETLGRCPGLDFATSVAFVNTHGFSQIDRTASVQLQDGTRCAFQSFDEIRSAESKALDSYEKAGEKPKKEDPKKDEPKDKEVPKPDPAPNASGN